MNDESYIDEEMGPNPELNRVTNLIIGAAIAVHRELGPGYSESTYEAALAPEFNARSIRFVRQAIFPVLYRGEQVGECRVDFLVEDIVVVELKAVETLHPLFTNQVISYLKATQRRLGLILNFNVNQLIKGVRRVAR